MALRGQGGRPLPSRPVLMLRPVPGHTLGSFSPPLPVPVQCGFFTFPLYSSWKSYLGCGYLRAGPDGFISPLSHSLSNYAAQELCVLLPHKPL